MSLYHVGRQKIRETFVIPLPSHKERLECTVYETWRDAQETKVVRCGLSEDIEMSVTTGVSEKLTTSIEGTLSASIGPKYLTTITAAVKAALGREVNWSESKTLKRTFKLTAPECGYYCLTTYQLCREYELSYFRRGGWLFSEKYWDRQWTETIIEKTSTYDGIPDKGYDERCKCPPQPPLECDGRLCLKFGNFSLRVPYKAASDGNFLILLAGQLVKFNFSEQEAAARGLHDGLVITVPTRSIPAPMLFLGGVPDSMPSLDATVYMYNDQPIARISEPAVAEPLTITVVKENIAEPAKSLAR